MHTYERRKRQAEFNNINKKQDSRNRGGAVKLDLSQLKTFEYLLQDPETPWVEQFIALVKAGQRQDKYTADRFNTAAEGMIIPPGVVGLIEKTIGREDIKFIDQDRAIRKKKPFSLETLTSQLHCTPEQAATVLAFIILLHDKHSIVSALKHPEVHAQFGANINEAAVKEFFRSEDFLNDAANKTLDRSMPLLAQQAGITGVQHIIRYLRVFQFQPNQEHLRRAFGTSRRRAEFRTLLMADTKQGLDMVPDFEYLFGEMTREEFLEIFPHWQEAENFRTYIFERRYSLVRPTPERTPTVPAPPEKMPSAVIQQTRAIEEQHGIQIPEDVKQLLRWGAVALGLASVGTVGAGAVAWEVSNRFTTEPATEAEKDNTYAAKPSLEQKTSIESNNFSPEGTEFENGDHFVAEPELHSMRVTAVYTTIEPHGVLTYVPELAFSIDPNELTAENSTQHIVAERFFAQGAILYPPEMGGIDPSSITVSGHTAGAYTITPGEQGRYAVLLSEPSSKPLEIVYTVRVATQDTLPYTGDIPPLPQAEQIEALTRAEELGLERKAGEDDLTYAVRAKTAIQSVYRYPKSSKEKDLSFDQARQAFIGDCDVANQDFLTLLQSQGIHAEMVVDTHPVPGRENHGQVRAITFSEELDGYVITELDATPHTYTAEGRRALTKRGAAAQVEEAPEDSEPELRAALKKLIDEYRVEKLGSAVSPDKAPLPPRPREVAPREWRALGGGIHGYARYVLQHSFSLPAQKEAQVKLTTELAAIMLQELQRTQVIPKGQDPYEWSKHIGPEQAEVMLQAMDSSDLVRAAVEHLPKYR